jgi:hypothetical protein
MKKIYLILAGIIVMLSSCNGKWSDYYFGGPISETKMDTTIIQYLNAHKEYAKYYEMLKKTGLDQELGKDQQMTVWAVKDSAMDVSGIQDNDTLRMKYHINHLPFLLTDLKAGLRIRSLNGIYFQIGNKDKDTKTLYANDSKIIKSVRLKDGVVYELGSLMKSRINLYDYLKNLGNDYSIIRDTIFKYNVEKFDKINSVPIGVDKTGNTVYDSIFYIDNPLFSTVQFNSEFKQFTVFLPSNQVISSCFQTLQSTYAKMGKTLAKSDSTLALKWIKEAMFYNGIYAPTGINTADITSAFSRVWRPTIQQLDLANPEYMSNGIVYKMNKVKIPNNVIITRIKSLVEYWEYQDADKLYPSPDDLYTFKGVKGNPSIYVADATPKPAILPNYIVLNVPGDQTKTNDTLSVEFPPLEKYYSAVDSKYHVRVMQVPTGEYTLYMGFWSSSHPYVNVYFNGTKISSDINAGLTTPWNYDRVTETEKDLNPTNGTAKWDGLGGTVGVVTVNGDGLASFKIKVEFSKPAAAGTKKTLDIYHWALKPTSNNY